MAKVHSVMNLEVRRFGILSEFAPVLLILPHLNADPERLFSMVRKIQTEERGQLDPFTVCDLLSVMISHVIQMHIELIVACYQMLSQQSLNKL